MPVPLNWLRRTIEVSSTPGSPMLPAGLSGGRHGPILALQTLEFWPKEILSLWHRHYGAVTRKQRSNQVPWTLYVRYLDFQLSMNLTGLNSSMFPKGVPEPSSQEVETTLAGMSHSKCYLATRTSVILKCLHWTFQCQQTNIPIKHAQPAPCCKSTCFCGQNFFLHIHLFPDMFGNLQRGHPLLRAPGKSTERAVAPEQAYLKVGWGTFATSTQSVLNHRTSPQQHISTLFIQSLFTNTLWDLTHNCAKKTSLLWSLWAEAFSSGIKIPFYYQAWINRYINDSCL